MLTVEKLAFLSRVDLFSGMSAKELGRIAEIAEEVVHPEGNELIREGDYGNFLLLIVEGEVRIHQGEQELTICRENDYIGEMTLLDGEPRSASATALTDCLLLRVNQAEFQEILASNFDTVLALMRALSQRIREKEKELRALSNK